MPHILKERWTSEQREDETLYDHHANRSTHDSEKFWHAVHDDAGLTEMISEMTQWPGGIEALAHYISALMRAPKECQAVAIEELRQTLTKWAVRVE